MNVRDSESVAGQDRRFVARSPVMQRVQQQAARAASVDSPVLITGGPGTGKTFLATEIHRRSRRRDGPFIRFSAAKTLSDGSLFGTNDDTADEVDGKRGALYDAEGGTLLIDEIAALWPTSQARLLQAIETGRAARMGGGCERDINVRVIATTSRNLDSEVRAGRFRQDLLYRISVLPIQLPPLRSRQEDIPELVSEFARRAGRISHSQDADLDSRQLQILKSLDWPQNVRQLRDVVEAMLAPRSEMPMSEMTANVHHAAPLALIEKDIILAALDSHDGNRTRAAESLGISVRTLQRRLREWHLDR